MAERQITIDELAVVALLQVRADRLFEAQDFQARAFERSQYEDAIDRLIQLARPDLCAIPFPSIPAASLSPDAAGGAAGPIPSGSAHPSEVERFLSECCEVAATNVERDAMRVKDADLYPAYRAWCENTRQTAERLRPFDFRRQLSQLGFVRRFSDGRWWVGIQLKATANNRTTAPRDLTTEEAELATLGDALADQGRAE